LTPHDNFGNLPQSRSVGHRTAAKFHHNGLHNRFDALPFTLIYDSAENCIFQQQAKSS